MLECMCADGADGMLPLVVVRARVPAGGAVWAVAMLTV